MIEYLKCLIESDRTIGKICKNTSDWYKRFAKIQKGDSFRTGKIRIIDDFEGALEIHSNSADTFVFTKEISNSEFKRKFPFETSLEKSFGMRLFLYSYKIPYSLCLRIIRLVDKMREFSNITNSSIAKKRLELEIEISSLLKNYAFADEKIEIFLKRLLINLKDKIYYFDLNSEALLLSILYTTYILQFFLDIINTNFFFNIEILPESCTPEFFISYLEKNSFLLAFKLNSKKKISSSHYYFKYAIIDLDWLVSSVNVIKLFLSNFLDKIKTDFEFVQILESLILSNYELNSQVILERYKTGSNYERKCLKKYLKKLNSVELLEFCVNILDDYI